MTTPPTWPSCWPGWARGQGGSRISEPQVSGHSGHAPGFLSTDSIPHLPFFGPPLKTTTLFQGHRNHCPEQPPACSAPLPSLNHHPGPWSCPRVPPTGQGEGVWAQQMEPGLRGRVPHPGEESGFVFLLPPLCTCRSPGCSPLPPVPPSAPFLTSCC